MTNEILSALGAIQAASGLWSGADWAHAREYHPGEDPVYCAGDGEAYCETCDSAEGDASAAEDFGEEAAAFLREGEWEKALHSLEAAASLEDNYGDSPVWGTARDRVRELFIARGGLR